MSRVNLFTISDKLNKAFPTVDTVGILKDLGVDYFSHPYSGLKPLDQTMFRDLWNQWRLRPILHYLTHEERASLEGKEVEA